MGRTPHGGWGEQPRNHGEQQRGGATLPWRLQWECRPADTLILDLHPPNLQDSTRLLLKPSLPCVPRKQAEDVGYTHQRHLLGSALNADPTASSQRT